MVNTKWMTNQTCHIVADEACTEAGSVVARWGTKVVVRDVAFGATPEASYEAIYIHKIHHNLDLTPCQLLFTKSSHLYGTSHIMDRMW